MKSVNVHTLVKCFIGVCLSMLLSSCATHPPLPKTASYVDRDRFEGEWYVISNIAYFGERNKVASKSIYKRRGDNLFDDIFESRSKNFDQDAKRLVGKIKSLNDDNTRWQSTFYWVMRFKFDVLYVDKDYQTMLFGHPSRDYGWIMSRSPTMGDKQYNELMQIFIENGYDISRFAKVPQRPEHIGAPGFHEIN